MPIDLKDIDKNVLYSVEEVSTKTGISQLTLRKYCRDGKLKARKAGGTWYIVGKNLLEFFGLGDNQ